jgi:hypothetical protein
VLALAAFLAAGFRLREASLDSFARQQLAVSPRLGAHLQLLISAWRPAATDLPLRIFPFLYAADRSASLSESDAALLRRAAASALLSAVPEDVALLHRARLLSPALSLESAAECAAACEAAGWAVPVGQSVSVYSTLCACVWDVLDEKSGEMEEQAPAFLAALRKRLGLGDLAHACHILFSALQRWSAKAAPEALAIARETAAGLSAFPVSPHPAAEATAHLRATLLPVLERSTLLLGDYHQHFPFGADRAFASLLDIHCCADAAMTALPGRPHEATPVAALIRRSASAAFTRAQSVDRDCAALAAAVSAAVEIEGDRFSSVLAAREPAATAVFAAQMHSLYSTALNSYLAASPAADGALRSLSAAEALFEGLRIPSALPPPDLGTLATPFATAWTAAALRGCSTWLERSLEREAWRAEAGAAPSAVDLARSLSETVDAFFAFRVHQSSPLSSLCAGLSSLMQTYGSRLASALGDASELVPKPEKLVRYKKEASELFLADRERRLSRPSTAPPERFSVDQILLMFTSLNFLLAEADSLAVAIARGWEGLAALPLALRLIFPTSDPPASPLASAVTALSSARAAVLAHAAGHILFIHLRSSFILRCYAFSVADDADRLPACLLSPLNGWMQRVCGKLGGEPRTAFCEAMLLSVRTAMLHLLLDGGATRFFALQDAALLNSDFEQLVDFFTAGGEGVAEASVRHSLAPVAHVLQLMAQQTDALVASHAAASGEEAGVLLRVLAHRADRAASKHLKERASLPKAAGRLAIMTRGVIG